LMQESLELNMEVTAFNRLEQKIEDLLNRLAALKDENADLRTALEQKEASLNDLGQQVQTLEQERDDVRGRIEQLVLKLESY
jgi:predicted  nucleic acid-binding Zn-ribbon protein